MPEIPVLTMMMIENSQFDDRIHAGYRPYAGADPEHTQQKAAVDIACGGGRPGHRLQLA